MLTAIFLALIGTSIFIIIKVTHKSPEPQEAEIVADNSTENITIIDTVVEDVEIEEENEYLLKSDDSDKFFEGYVIEQDENTAYIASEEVQSSYGLLINLDTGKVVASKDGNVRINPASMTKILTLLVAVEHLDDIDNYFSNQSAIGAEQAAKVLDANLFVFPGHYIGKTDSRYADKKYEYQYNTIFNLPTERNVDIIYILHQISSRKEVALKSGIKFVKNDN